MNTNEIKPTLLWGDHATADVLSILDYISADDPVAAERVVEQIGDRVGNLPANPRMGRPGRVEGTRELVIPKNYVVVYKEDPEEVVVLRVLHAKQQWPV